MSVGSISTCSPPGPALWVQRMGSLNEGQRRAGAGHSGRCPLGQALPGPLSFIIPHQAANRFQGLCLYTGGH